MRKSVVLVALAAFAAPAFAQETKSEADTVSDALGLCRSYISASASAANVAANAREIGWTDQGSAKRTSLARQAPWGTTYLSLGKSTRLNAAYCQLSVMPADKAKPDSEAAYKAITGFVKTFRPDMGQRYARKPATDAASKMVQTYFAVGEESLRIAEWPIAEGEKDPRHPVLTVFWVK